MTDQPAKSSKHTLVLGCCLAAWGLLLSPQRSTAGPPRPARHQTATGGNDPALIEQVDRLVQPYMDEKIARGMVVGTIRGDQSWTRGYGRVGRGDPAKPDGETVYEIGSITKVFTALMLARAVVRGEAQLDQPVAAWLPEGVPMPQHGDQPITLRHLATHSSGLPRMPGNFAPADPQDPYADYTAEDLHAFLSGYTSRRAPAAELEYSNLGFGLLGQILADRAGKSYAELVREQVTGPLGMEDTGVVLTEPIRARLAPPYTADLAPASNWRFQAMAGAGALRSTARDMLRFARAQLDPADSPAVKAAELGPALELAWRIHQPPIDEDDFAMGLGWHVARDGTTRWHNGQTGGYHTMMLIDRPRRIAVVVLSNTATMEIDALAEQLMRLFAGVPETPRAFAEPAEVPVGTMRRLVGRYRLAPNFVLTVSLDQDKLMVGATGQAAFRVYPNSDTEWRYRVVDAELTFELGDDGPAAAVVLHQNGLDQRADRIE